MKPWQTLRTATLGRQTLTLKERAGEFMIQVDGQVLMVSRRHGSEESLATLALKALAKPPAHILLGGLGMGYSLRATLDLLPTRAQVTMAEISPDLVEWNRTVLAPLSGQALEDARCTVEVADVTRLIGSSKPGSWDAILLDVDNGPAALTCKENGKLYTSSGVAVCYRALKAGGALAVWSAGPDVPFEAQLSRAGFDATVHPVKAAANGGSRHRVFLGVKGERKTHARTP